MALNPLDSGDLEQLALKGLNASSPSFMIIIRAKITVNS